jgi:chromosome segregation ATPase
VKQDEETIRTQEKRLAELLEQGRQAADTAEERVRQVQELTTELHTGSTMKDELSAELSRVQARQREVTEQTQLTEDQVHRVEEQMKRLDQRRSQVAFADKKLVAFEGRLGELSVMSSEVDRQIQALESRQTLVGSVKREVDEVQQISAKSKADLQHVVEHRGEVDALRARVEEALRGIGETEDRIGVIEAKRKVVDDAHRKTNAIVHLLEDVRVNLEMVSEQKAVIDHVVENVATLDETLRAAQATQRSLRVERELAERIERGIKSLRTKIGTTDTRDEEEQTA